MSFPHRQERCPLCQSKIQQEVLEGRNIVNYLIDCPSYKSWIYRHNRNHSASCKALRQRLQHALLQFQRQNAAWIMSRKGVKPCSLMHCKRLSPRFLYFLGSHFTKSPAKTFRKTHQTPVQLFHRKLKRTYSVGNWKGISFSPAGEYPFPFFCYDVNYNWPF